MEKRTQLMFQDDFKFKFIKRPLEFFCFVEKKNDLIERGWIHSYSNEYRFPGYKNISADAVTLTFNRDIILDPHNRIPEGTKTSEKPKSDKESIKAWIAQIGENQRHTYRSKRKTYTKGDIVTFVLLGVLGVMILAWIIKFLV
jgi:hypothetical protein